LTLYVNFQVLDPTVEENPLTRLGGKEEEDTDEDESSESENDSDSKESDMEESESDLEDEGNETVNDKLRAAVRDALGFAAPLTDTVTCC
jgi:DNA-directed RNA polymerase specialized sigma54-like protein